MLMSQQDTLNQTLRNADKIIVAFSGGKDSLACALHLISLGYADKMELWHHSIDADGQRFMDWPVTESYCVAAAAALGLPLLRSYRTGGFLQELLRDSSPTGAVRFQSGVDGPWMSAGGKGPGGTRQKFPQVSADLKVRWCSAYLKIDVGRRVFANDPRFHTGSYVLVSGERREESAARSKYAEFEPDECSNQKRTIMRWRPVIDWSEERVWAIIRQARINPHPAYHLGWGRVSCMLCIFGGPDQWASARKIAPAQFQAVSGLEQRFGLTIQRGKSIETLADAGQVYAETERESLVALAMSEVYTDAIRLMEWRMPSGAFRRTGGPT